MKYAYFYLLFVVIAFSTAKTKLAFEYFDVQLKDETNSKNFKIFKSNIMKMEKQSNFKNLDVTYTIEGQWYSANSSCPDFYQLEYGSKLEFYGLMDYAELSNVKLQFSIYPSISFDSGNYEIETEKLSEFLFILFENYENYNFIISINRFIEDQEKDLTSYFVNQTQQIFQKKFKRRIRKCFTDVALLISKIKTMSYCNEIYINMPFHTIRDHFLKKNFKNPNENIVKIIYVMDFSKIFNSLSSMIASSNFVTLSELSYVNNVLKINNKKIMKRVEHLLRSNLLTKSFSSYLFQDPSQIGIFIRNEKFKFILVAKSHLIKFDSIIITREGKFTNILDIHGMRVLINFDLNAHLSIKGTFLQISYSDFNFDSSGVTLFSFIPSLLSE